MELADEMEKILEYLNKHGEGLDTEISAATRIPLNNLHLHLNELMAKKEVMTFHATRYVDCIKSEVMICRLARKGPAIKPLRKSKPHTLN
jgi:transcription initiation factor IIE alpha subunit